MSRWTQCKKRWQQHLGGRAMGPMESPACQSKNRERKSERKGLGGQHSGVYKDSTTRWEVHINFWILVNQNEAKSSHIKILVQYNFYTCTSRNCLATVYINSISKITLYRYNLVLNLSSHIHSKHSFIVTNAYIHTGITLKIYNNQY